MTLVGVAIITAASIGGSIHQGEVAAKSARAGLRAKKAAQDTSMAQAAGQRKLGAMEEAKANRKKPNIATLLGRNRGAKGPSSTMLTGTGGAGGGLLGGKSMLGGA